MTISSSLNAGVSGLAANATRLASISDNIANSSTTGYRRTVVDFSSQVLEQQSSSAYSAGGVIANAFKDVNQTGALSSTDNSTDLAVSGRGLLPVTDATGIEQNSAERDLLLVPTGSFTPDQNGNLRTSSGLFLLGWPADGQGEIGNVNRSNQVDLQPINLEAVQLDSESTTRIDLGINLPANETTPGSGGDPIALPLQYFDNLGRNQTLTLNFTPTVDPAGATNLWTLDIQDSSSGTPVSVGSIDLTFTDAAANPGSISGTSNITGLTYDGAAGELNITLPHGDVDIFIGRVNDSEGITQLAAPFSPTLVDVGGAPIGELQSVEVDEQGLLRGTYDNGFSRTLFQIPVADVPDLNALTTLEAQAYSVSSESGELFLFDAGSGPVGGIAGFALQESNTDIATELTDLIETQRAYSSNATLIQAVDEILQETTNLRR